MTSAVVSHDQASLSLLVRQAANTLANAETAAQVLDARDKAGLAYDTAKTAARLQKARRAHDDVIHATYQVQADALEIESEAKSRLAEEYAAAQKRGEVAGHGGKRSSKIPDGNLAPATLDDIGLSPKQVFESRQFSDAIRSEPGIVRRALDELLASGDEPTRAALKRAIQPAAKSLGIGRENLRAAVGTDSASAAERGDNLYETPPEAMRTLLSLCRFSPTVWEPACGKGAISRFLEDAGYDVVLSDLRDYGTANRDGELQQVGDFLTFGPHVGNPDIVTNPPYGASLNAFVAHALRVHRPRRMALLLNLNFLAGFEDPDRCYAMDECPPSRIYVFMRRLPMMHRDGWDGPEASSRMNTAWFIWELRQEGGEETYAGPTEIVRVDWKVFENAMPIGPKPESERGEPREDKPHLSGECPEAPPVESAPAAAVDGAAGSQGTAVTLTWSQPYEGGRLLAKLGEIEVGAVFPDEKGCTWSFWLGAVTGQHKRAKTVDAAKANGIVRRRKRRRGKVVPA
jgi:hypothetical protein